MAFMEAKSLTQRSEAFCYEHHHCCLGGRRVKWQCTVHNSPRLHRALHKPYCPGHDGLLSYEPWEDQEGNLCFPTSGEAEYPEIFCKLYAEALAADLNDRFPSP